MTNQAMNAEVKESVPPKESCQLNSKSWLYNIKATSPKSTPPITSSNIAIKRGMPKDARSPITGDDWWCYVAAVLLALLA
eukprot:6243030-Prymnesium_polylepis.1